MTIFSVARLQNPELFHSRSCRISFRPRIEIIFLASHSTDIHRRLRDVFPWDDTRDGLLLGMGHHPTNRTCRVLLTWRERWRHRAGVDGSVSSLESRVYEGGRRRGFESWRAPLVGGDCGGRVWWQ